MSYLTDALRLLDEEAVALSFLPAINCGYVFWRLPDPGWWAYSVTSLAIIAGAAMYNSYAHINFDAFDRTRYGKVEIVKDGQETQVRKEGKGDIVDKWSLVGVGLITLLWALVFLQSLLDLMTLLKEQSVWPTVLMMVSVLTVCLVGTELVFSRWLPSYRAENSTDNPNLPDIDRFVDKQGGILIYTISLSEDSEPVVVTVPLEKSELDLDEITELDLEREEFTRE